MDNSIFSVGVTGHRDIAATDTDAAAAAVSRFLGDLIRRLPDSEILVFSGLADGADRIAARAALDLGLTVCAVTPMPVAEYEKDFAPRSLEDFRSLLNEGDVDLIELPMPDDGDRDAAYRQLSDCLIRKSNILLALWDGDDSRLSGGTSDTLLSFLTERDGPEPAPAGIQVVTSVPVDINSNEFAYWVPVRRESARPTATEDHAATGTFLLGVPGTSLLLAQEAMPDALRIQLQQLNEYGADFRALGKKGAALPTWGVPDLSESGRAGDAEGFLGDIEMEFNRADSLALFYQSKSDRLFKGFSVAAAIMGLLFLSYAKLAASNILLYGYVALFVAGFATFRIAGSRRWFAKHLMYRVVAETLRIKFFLRLAGAESLVDVRNIARQAGIDKFSGFSWIAHVFRSAEPVVAARAAGPLAEQRFEEARRLWVADQSKYFSNKIHSMHHKHHRVEWIKQLLLAATLVGIFVLIVFKYPLLTVIPGTELPYKKLLVFFMGLFPFWLGVWEIYHNKMATKELLWQYRNQADAFALTEFQLDHAGKLEQRQKILARQATDALFENYLWTIHRFHREHEPPAAG